jgi:hypothetical protein
MQALSATEILTVWERGAGQTLPQRALGLLTAASPDTTPDALARLSIGQRDARLLTLRAWMFSPRLAGLTNCPQCGEVVDLAFDTGEILTPREPDTMEEFSITIEDYVVRFRLPASSDLADLAEPADRATARDQLLDRCFLAAQHNGGEISVTELPTHIVVAVVDHMAQADPQGDVQLALSCPSCKHGWQATFDIVSFFWREINAWAYRILREVHTLAAAYGWSEADVLGMSAWRRQVYLEMVNT